MKKSKYGTLSQERSWKSMDASVLNQAFECDAEAQSALGSKNGHGLPPPTKFANVKQKDMEISGGSCSSFTRGDNNVVRMDSRPVTSVSADFEQLNYVDTNAAPCTSTQAERRKLRKSINFAAGLQNEVERRRQTSNG